jgi:hypothetical protein
MKPMISEFSYGYVLTEELASGRAGPIVGAPVFPTLTAEGTWEEATILSCQEKVHRCSCSLS